MTSNNTQYIMYPSTTAGVFRRQEKCFRKSSLLRDLAIWMYVISFVVTTYAYPLFPFIATRKSFAVVEEDFC